MVGYTSNDTEMEDQYGEGDFYSDDKSESEKEDDDCDCPNIRLSREERQWLRKPF